MSQGGAGTCVTHVFSNTEDTEDTEFLIEME